MKKTVLIVCAALIVVALIATTAACFTVEDGEYTIYAPDGAPALAVSAIAADPYVYNGARVGVQVVSSSEIMQKAAAADMAVVPANIAANLRNKGTDLTVVATVTHGNLYMIGKPEAEDVTDLASLKGKVIASIGQNSVPDLLFKSMLAKNGIEYVVQTNIAAVTPAEGKVTIVYGKDGSAVIPVVKTGKAAYAIVGEPAVSIAGAKAGLVQKGDMQAMWNSVNGSEGGYSQAVLVMKSQLAKDKKFVQGLIDRINSDVTAMKESDENAKQAYLNIKANYDGTTLAAALTADIVKRCNISATGIDTKEGFDEFYAMLTAVSEIDSSVIGGSVPAENSGFYYGR